MLVSQGHNDWKYISHCVEFPEYNKNDVNFIKGGEGVGSKC